MLVSLLLTRSTGAGITIVIYYTSTFVTTRCLCTLGFGIFTLVWWSIISTSLINKYLWNNKTFKSSSSGLQLDLHLYWRLRTVACMAFMIRIIYEQKFIFKLVEYLVIFTLKKDNKWLKIYTLIFIYLWGTFDSIDSIRSFLKMFHNASASLES